MLKFIFVSLLLANAGLFAFHQGYLDDLVSSGHEPARIRNQINADKIKLLNPVPAPPPATPEALIAVPRPVTAAVEENDADNKALALVCTEIGNFSLAEGRKLEAQWSKLGLTDRPARREVIELSSHMIFMPPQKGKEGADQKIAELRQLGITDFYVLQDSSDMRWGISLGVFKSEEAARAQLAALSQRGVRSARLIEHKVELKKTAFRLYAPAAQMSAYIDKIKNSFPNQEVRSCT